MSNSMRKINRNKDYGHSIDIRSEKKFLKCIRETMLDFEAALNIGYGSTSDILNSLKNILQGKKLYLENVKELIPLIENGKTSLNINSFIDMSIIVEHQYMEEVLLKYFTWTIDSGLCSISFRNKEVT